jgi:hypothetical protein
MKTLFRNIIECTDMQNNDEWAFYSVRELKLEDIKEMPNPRGEFYGQPRLRISRPVADLEIKAGLNPNERKYERNSQSFTLKDKMWRPLPIDIEMEVPEETFFLDALYKFKEFLEFTLWLKNEKNKSLPESTIIDSGIDKEDPFNPSNTIAYYVGDNFYDCMSGGMSSYLVSLIRFLIEKGAVDTKVPVYPHVTNPDGSCTWSTLEDFYKETSYAEKWEEVIQEFRIVRDALPCLKLVVDTSEVERVIR